VRYTGCNWVAPSQLLHETYSEAAEWLARREKKEEWNRTQEEKNKAGWRLPDKDPSARGYNSFTGIDFKRTFEGSVGTPMKIEYDIRRVSEGYFSIGRIQFPKTKDLPPATKFAKWSKGLVSVFGTVDPRDFKRPDYQALEDWILKRKLPPTTPYLRDPYYDNYCESIYNKEREEICNLMHNPTWENHWSISLSPGIYEEAEIEFAYPLYTVRINDKEIFSSPRTTPMDDLLNAYNTIMDQPHKPDTILMSPEVWRVWKNDEELREYLSVEYNSPATERCLTPTLEDIQLTENFEIDLDPGDKIAIPAEEELKLSEGTVMCFDDPYECEGIQEIKSKEEEDPHKGMIQGYNGEWSWL
jgi:hypothetical protein